MADPTEPATLVLHALRLKGFADTDVLAAHAGLSEGDVTKHLDRLAADGLARRRDGRVAGWSLTPDGRARHAEAVTAEASECRDAVHAAYRDFLALNNDMLSVCTDWQMRTVDGEATVNDHSDSVYDKEVVTRLRGVDDRVQPVCARLAEAVPRFGGYGPRLRSALERVEAGDTKWFTQPIIDSYHTVWFELHEDLLCTLGIERSKEEA